MIEQKNAKFIKEHLPTIHAVPGQIHQLFYNLINNSLKFSKPGYPVHITIRSAPCTEQTLIRSKHLDESKQYIRVDVADNGIGFDQKYAQQIFELFKRLHAKNEFEGTGIGLALCKKIVENHNGAIWADGQSGKGSTFSILLPA
ncbi:sensor histidine kinase [Chryseosolibacter indicus]|uniref:histidine kinase n=1 Tax=Chryseosolibacter indicus TaxID=2782351 RepID=A0ABS5VX17_9BACT|nr:hypothetical protein [Chryseosolibacter indicus]